MLAESDTTPLFMGCDGEDLFGGRHRACSATTFTTAMSSLHNDPYQRREPLSRRRHSSCPIFLGRRARRVLGRVCTPDRTSAAPTRGMATDRRRHLGRGKHLPMLLKLSSRRGCVRRTSYRHDPRRTYAHPDPQPRRHRGHDRLRRACQERATWSCYAATARTRVLDAARTSGSPTPSACCGRRSPRYPTVSTRSPVGWLDDDGREPRRSGCRSGSR